MPRQGRVDEKEWRAKGRCEAGLVRSSACTSRVKGRMIKWTSRSKGREQHIFLERSNTLHQKYRTVKLSMASTSKDKFLSDPKYAFALETYANGTPSPNILPKEVDIARSGSSFCIDQPRLFENRGGKGLRSHHCCSAID